jgi:hypothetical protein
MTINQALTEAAIAQRGETLFTSQGYEMTVSETDPETFIVRKPGHSVNAVVMPQGFCTCESYQHRKTCKHSIAVRLELDRDAALCAEYDLNMASAEMTSGYCDYAEH